MKLSKIIILIGLLVGLPILIRSSSGPPQKHRLEGWVLDGRGVGVKGVTVFVVAGNRARDKSQSPTDSAGHFVVDFEERGNSIDVYYDAREATVESLTLEGLSGRRPHSFTKVLFAKGVARSATEIDLLLTSASGASAIEWPDPATASGIKADQARMLNELRIDTTVEPPNRKQLQFLYFKQSRTRELYGMDSRPLRDASNNAVMDDFQESLTETNTIRMIDQLRQMRGVSVDSRQSSKALAEQLLSDMKQKSRP